MPLSVAGADKFLNALRGADATAFPNVYLGFLTADPTFTPETLVQVYSEPLPINVDDNGYRRTLIGETVGTTKLLDEVEYDASSPTTSTKRLTRNLTKSIITQECINEDWTPILNFALFSTEEVGSGDMICWGRLQDSTGTPITSAIAVTQGKIPIFRRDCFELSFKIKEETT